MSTLTELDRPAVHEQVGTLPQKESSPGPQPVLLDTFFKDVLVESAGFQQRRRGAATVVSFIIQCMLLGVMVIIPLMITDTLPAVQLMTFLVAPPPPPPPPPPAAQAPIKVVHIASDLSSNGQLRTPTRIPAKVEIVKEEEAPPPPSYSGGVVGGVPGGIPGGQLGGVIGGIISSTAHNTLVVPKLAPPQRVRISQGVSQGQLIQKIVPQYPSIARSARIQGIVVLAAIISREGSIQDLKVISGHPFLVPPALAAVQQWRYRPYLLSGVPVEVETTITVDFTLSQ
jgi:protein TonB